MRAGDLQSTLGSLYYGFHVFRKSVRKDNRGIVEEGELHVLISYLSISPLILICHM